ncbi:hypothetical protein A2673_00405 [Candidatus Kaiserbacteria bacterium RIFCSPHIGHO2_01_FULL_50_13]|uniref:Ig-like domain-containing protein n=1 Tax=Candidatus Kaiserbacteria bacterium RIFCSPLOWO2_01_FULL_50_24 TaxID=1798507 RepID=A0A1F6EI29_9BACT|nr:MAG: hypothetical protein A2673_00405 [Candidatus Kaiserbacteria bacterium RIFCSPHIGHO2_01_FULL_50_13]OGG73294.1 MAG: hypothetical protein A3A34_03370 [Candidatus Kaiserbacteria bacterium RIFCSPLOWO2_01_FULL_50_24]OGG81202.1 MAG: hypothetical protein A3H74_00810 [Candidatus Kaiserbacteria bacterium RIFCSPLOWO2_02_FULL_51_13]
MRVLYRLTIVIATLLWAPITSAGELEFNTLPFQTLAGGCRGSSPDTEGSAQCRWRKNGPGNYSVKCTVNINDQTIVMQAQIRPIRRINESIPPVSMGREFQIDEIICKPGFLLFLITNNLRCADPTASKFTCGWCEKDSCYEGTARFK